MHRATTFSLLLLFCMTFSAPAQETVFEIPRATKDIAISTDPTTPFWRDAKGVIADRGNFGELHERHRTEIRSRWTEQNLYFLFICSFEKLNLNPSPNPKVEKFKLWDWDVAEVFIGNDFENIRRYKEFEISPQGEWVDLDIDLSNPHHEDGWIWNSKFTLEARIDPVAKIWYGAMRIPFSALQHHSGQAGQTFRINFYRTEGAEPDKVSVMWQPTMEKGFHVPEKFGRLRLIDSK